MNDATRRKSLLDTMMIDLPDGTIQSVAKCTKEQLTEWAERMQAITVAWKQAVTPEYDALSRKVSNKVCDLGEAADVDTKELDDWLSNLSFLAFKAGYVAGKQTK